MVCACLGWMGRVVWRSSVRARAECAPSSEGRAPVFAALAGRLRSGRARYGYAVATLLAVGVPAALMFRASASATAPWWAADLRFAFGVGALKRWLDAWLPRLVLGFGACFALAAARSLLHAGGDAEARSLLHAGGDAAARRRPAGVVGRLVRLVWGAVVVCVSAGVCGLSVLHMREIAPGVGDLVPLAVHAAAGATRQFGLSSPYGLFRRMTGVGPDALAGDGRRLSRVARPEVVIEGSLDDGGGWRELEFMCARARARAGAMS